MQELIDTEKAYVGHLERVVEVRLLKPTVLYIIHVYTSLVVLCVRTCVRALLRVHSFASLL